MRACLRTLSLAICVVSALTSGCNGGSRVIAGTGSPTSDKASSKSGKVVIETYGCGKCHTVPGIHDANGVVGPPLMSVARRTYIAGNFPNNPDTLTRWIMAPQAMKPKTAMPSLGLSESQSRDVVAYLETLH